MKKIHYILFFLLCQLSQLNAQDFRFALITDTHIADNTSAAEDLKNSIEQINATPNLDFVLVTGDISENGDRKSLQIAHDLLSQLKIRYYISNSVDNNRSSCSAVTFKVSLAPIASDMVPVSSDTIITMASVRSEIPKAARCLKPKNLGISVF